jgi:hypothetical protein
MALLALQDLRDRLQMAVDRVERRDDAGFGSGTALNPTKEKVLKTWTPHVFGVGECVGQAAKDVLIDSVTGFCGGSMREEWISIFEASMRETRTADKRSWIEDESSLSFPRERPHSRQVEGDTALL